MTKKGSRCWLRRKIFVCTAGSNDAMVMSVWESPESHIALMSQSRQAGDFAAVN